MCQSICNNVQVKNNGITDANQKLCGSLWTHVKENIASVLKLASTIKCNYTSSLQLIFSFLVSITVVKLLEIKEKKNNNYIPNIHFNLHLETV